MAGKVIVASRRPQNWRPIQGPPSPGASRGLASAIQALRGHGPTLEGDAAFAQMEQHRIDAEAKRQRQGCLPLGSRTE